MITNWRQSRIRLLPGRQVRASEPAFETTTQRFCVSGAVEPILHLTRASSLNAHSPPTRGHKPISLPRAEARSDRATKPEPPPTAPGTPSIQDTPWRHARSSPSAQPVHPTVTVGRNPERPIPSRCRASRATRITPVLSSPSERIPKGAREGPGRERRGPSATDSGYWPTSRVTMLAGSVAVVTVKNGKKAVPLCPRPT
jgi:hypothetical protein